MGKKKYRILNTELSIRSDKAVTQYPSLKDNVAAKSRFIEQIILYDRVHLVTKNFLVIPLLVEWAGMDNLLRLLRNNRISFARPKGFIGYDGKYKSMEYFIFLPRFSGNFDKDWLKIADTADIKTSLSTIVKKSLQGYKDSELAELDSLVIKNAKEVDDPKIPQRIHDETASDFLDEEIRKKLLISAKDLKSACDISADQLKIGFDEGIFDPEKSREIDKAFAIGLTNFDFMIAEAIGDVDIHTDNVSQLILEAKLKRNLKSRLLDNGLRTLLHFKKIPDFRSLVERNLLDFNKLLDLLGSIHHIQFVHWLHNLPLESSDDILSDYISRLESTFHKDDVKTRTIRFMATTGLSALAFPVGIVTSAIDSFIVSDILKGWHPTLFLDKFRSTIGK